jgi:Ca2+-binding EF-hand superfamily protein
MTDPVTEEDLRIMAERELKRKEIRAEHFAKLFEEEMKRIPTLKEVEDYFYLFDKDKINFFEFIEKLKTKDLRCFSL